MGKWRGKENPTWQGGRSKWNPTCIIVPDDKEIDRTLLIVWPNQGALYDSQINRISSHFCQIGHIKSCNVEKLAMEEGLDELFDGESIEDRVFRGVPRKEAEEMEGS